MRIVIDMQGAQSSGSRNRGIGRYSVALVKSILDNRGDHNVFLVLSGLFPETIDPIRATFSGLLPQENILVWQAPGPVLHIDSQFETRRKNAELIREQFIASLSPDFVLVSSLWEGLTDDAVTSIGLLPTAFPTAVIMYDLIPLIYSDVYLANPLAKSWYHEKLEHTKRASLLLSISNATEVDCEKFLDIDNDTIFNISSAVDKNFSPAAVPPAIAEYISKTYGLSKPFVMYTGGIDYRKNIEGLVKAYSQISFDIRSEHQLAIVCSIQPSERDALLSLARSSGLRKEEIVLTGFVPEDDLRWLYRSCKLFVFASLYEGFGLPALEAIKCGAATVASNTSSLPEVVGCDDALFDPKDLGSIAAKITQALTDDEFCAKLKQTEFDHAKQFSWDASAKKALKAIEESHSRHQLRSILAHRPRLAFVSPLRPAASGISDYSAELLPELAEYYDVEVVVAQDDVSDDWVRANCQIRNVDWFREHAHEFDRILYHIGNSHFHNHMFELLNEYPGVVVLHDFYVSGIIAQRDINGESPHCWTNALLSSHGWTAVAGRYRTHDIGEIIYAYPANLTVLQDALGVIVHAEYSQQLAREWYGERAAEDWRLIPHMRQGAGDIDRAGARRALGIAEDAFVVCSFGHLGPTKRNHRLLAAWLASPLAKDPQCHLVFVGENDGGDYGSEVKRSIRAAKDSDRIRITGWVNTATFRLWLGAADIGVQLRTLSRGETSGTVLDCMNYGLATIVNANGSMAELDQEAVWILPDEFDDDQLVEALTTLWTDKQSRIDRGRKAREVIARRHSPPQCAAMYADAIENYYQQASVGLPGLLTAIGKQASELPAQEIAALGHCIAKNAPPKPRCRQLLVDVSELSQRDAKSGIQRVVRSILNHWLQNPPRGWTVEPVYATMEADGYRYARRFSCDFLGIPDDWALDEVVEAYPGDIFFGLDLHHHLISRQAEILKGWRRRGVGVHFVVYDLLPVLKPEQFPAGIKDLHKRWLETITQFDGAVCISRAVADELRAWLAAVGLKRDRPFEVRWFHLGGDTENSVPSIGIPTDAPQVLATLRARPSFLCVGSIEPRKGHAQTLEAFETLWADGFDTNLVFVGKQGWNTDGLIDRLRGHVEIGKRLFWLEAISDEYLDAVYSASNCLIAGSEGEGFGLPLIEAARHKLPIIARDLPVFREVAGEHALYFENTKDAQVLANAVIQWFKMVADGNAPQSDMMPWITWEQSAQQLIDLVTGKQTA